MIRLSLSPSTLASLVQEGAVLPYDDVYRLGEPEAVDEFAAALRERGLVCTEADDGRGYIIERIT